MVTTRMGRLVPSEKDGGEEGGGGEKFPEKWLRRGEWRVGGRGVLTEV